MPNQRYIERYILFLWSKVCNAYSKTCISEQRLCRLIGVMCHRAVGERRRRKYYYSVFHSFNACSNLYRDRSSSVCLDREAVLRGNVARRAYSFTIYSSTQYHKLYNTRAMALYVYASNQPNHGALSVAIAGRSPRAYITASLVRTTAADIL